MINKGIYDILTELAIGQNNPSLALKCNHEYILQNYNQEREHKQLVNEIVDEVLARISVSADTNNAITQINSLNEAIKRLGK